MREWIDSESVIPHLLLVVAAVAALLIGLALALLWAASSRRAAASARETFELKRDLADAERDLSEQQGRVRMVRELQEVAIRSLSAIVSQADGARYLSEADPSAASRAAGAVADAARSTLTELRRVMSVVRQGELEHPQQPGLASVRGLFEDARQWGLLLRFEESGARFELGQAVETAIFKILNEALSNAAKFGGPDTEVRVAFRWSEKGLNVLVDDDGVRASTRRAGQDPNSVSRQGGYTVDDDAAALTSAIRGRGITEMRERTELFGGIFNAYVVPGVGFSVSAAFPTIRYDKGVPRASGKGD